MEQRPQASDPAAYAEINSLLNNLLKDAQAILGDQLIGFYIDGSLAFGGFDPATSDIDFIMATAGDLPDEIVGQLAAIHRRITLSNRAYADQLEGSYIPLSALRRYNPTDATHPNIERGPNEVLRPKYHHSDWVIHRYIAREHGITLHGPSPKALIDPVTPDDLRWATAEALRSWWATLEAAESIRRSHPGYRGYVTQTMCRALYTLEHGEVIDKATACRWALDSCDEQWRPLIKNSRSRNEAIEVEHLLQYISYVHERAGNVF